MQTRKEYRLLVPQQLPAVYTHVKETLPDSIRDPNIFAQIYWAKTSAFFELGDMEGALWLVNIAVGWKATVHLVLWGERLRHRAEDALEITKELFHLFQLRRLEAYLPVTNERVCRYLDKLGFVMEGTLRKWDYYDGMLVDIAVYSILKEDFDG